MASTSSIMNSTAPCKFIWKIENFSSLNDTEEHGSDKFVVDGSTWTVRILPKGVENGHLGMFLIPEALGSQSAYVKFSFAVFNQKDHKKTVKYDTQQTFPNNNKGKGWSKMLALSDLHNPDKGFILDDTCIFHVEISACNKVALIQTPLYPNAGKPFQLDQEVVFCEENSENIGGFTVLKRHSCLYNKIWIKYGHLGSTKILPLQASSYDHGLVTLVTDIMNTIDDMYRCPLTEVSAEMISAWESKLSMAEKLQFNVQWLRVRFNDVKKGVNNEVTTKVEKEQAPIKKSKGKKKAPIKAKKVKVEAEEEDAKVKNEPDEARESLPGFVLEGVL